jgi:hypothetical protein
VELEIVGERCSKTMHLTQDRWAMALQCASHTAQYLQLDALYINHHYIRRAMFLRELIYRDSRNLHTRGANVV